MSGADPSRPPPARLLAAMDATWAPAARHRIGGWDLREGRGGGQRVSCLTWEAAGRLPAPAEIAEAETAAGGLGQPALFRVGAGQEALADRLAAAGHAAGAPVLFYAAALAGGPAADWEAAPLGAFALWPPLQIQRELWADGGIGAARQAVMDRAPAPRAAILGRSRDRAAGTAFVAVQDGIAMLHALVVPEPLRRQGSARRILAEAARWAGAAGASHLALAVEAANAPARALYAGLGMEEAGSYRYLRRAGGA